MMTFEFFVAQVCWWSMLPGETRPTWAPYWTAHGMTGLPHGKEDIGFCSQDCSAVNNLHKLM